MAHATDDKAAALAALQANGGNVLRTARQLGIPEATLRKWKNGETGTDRAQLEVAEKCEVKKGELADALENIAHVAAGLLPNKLKGASASQVAMSMGIAIDKMRLLRGESTEITEDVTDARDSLQRKLDSLAARAAAPGVVPGPN